MAELGWHICIRNAKTMRELVERKRLVATRIDGRSTFHAERCCTYVTWRNTVCTEHRRRPYLISFPMKKKRWPVAELRRRHEHKVPSNEFWPGIRFVKFCVWVVCWFHRMPTMAFMVVVNTVLPSHTVSAIYLQGCKCASSKCTTHNSAWRA